MHYSKLNSQGKDDEFRPSDFLDLDSAGDSDNEILAKFKSKDKPPADPILNLL